MTPSKTHLLILHSCLTCAGTRHAPFEKLTSQTCFDKLAHSRTASKNGSTSSDEACGASHGLHGVRAQVTWPSRWLAGFLPLAEAGTTGEFSSCWRRCTSIPSPPKSHNSVATTSESPDRTCTSRHTSAHSPSLVAWLVEGQCSYRYIQGHDTCQTGRGACVS